MLALDCLPKCPKPDSELISPLKKMLDKLFAFICI